MKGRPQYETPAEEIMITLNTIFPVLKRLFGIRSIGVFGRIAHGEDTPGGVIELLVEFSPAMESYEVYSGLIAFLGEKFGCGVLLVTPRMLEVQPVPADIPEQTLSGDDASLIGVILDECAQIQEECRDLAYSRFLRNKLARDIVANGLDRAGLAVVLLPEEFRVLHPRVDWTALICLRMHLVRNPYGVDSLILWNAVHEVIPGIEQRVREVKKSL